MKGMVTTDLKAYKQSIIDSISSSEDRIFMSRVLDQLELCEKYYEPRFTDFIDPHRQNILSRKLVKPSDLNLLLWGGYEDAERKVACFYPEYLELEHSQFPITLLQITGHHISKLSHRDFLGAILGLGIKREKIGDIIIHNEACYCFCTSDIASYILIHLAKVGQVNVSITEKSVHEISLPEKKFKLINSTVASLRLDSVVSAGLGESRSKVLAYIQAERVNVNWETVQSPSYHVKEGDVISVRGHGRMELDLVGGMTRKGRVSITIKRYI